MDSVVLYLRVSTSEQKDYGYSLQYQKEALLRYCEIKNLNVLAIYEEDFTGTTFDRPKFNEMLSFIQSNRRFVNKLLFIKWDRFARNAHEAFSMISKLRGWGVQVNASEQPLDIEQPENKMLLSIYLVQGEIESDKTSMRTKDGMYQASLEGRCVSRPPIGYINAIDEFKNKIIVPGEKAPLVVEAFELLAKGVYTREDVRKMMLKKGLKRTKTSFKDMMQNVNYIGKIKVKAYKKNPEKIVDGQHTPIISEELFHKVQSIITGYTRKSIRHKKRDSNLPLRGYLKCAVCGRNLTGEGAVGNGGKYYYYKCQRDCKERFSANEAHEDFEYYLQNLTVTQEQSEMFLKVMGDIFKSKEGDRKSEIGKIDQQINKVENDILKLEQKYYVDDNSISLESFERLSNHLKGQLLELKTEKCNLLGSDSNFDKYYKFGVSVFSNLRTAYEEAPIEVKQKILSSIFPNKLVYSQKKYRTTVEPDSMLHILFNINELRDGEKEKAAENSGLSYKAPPLGLEPRTP